MIAISNKQRGKSEVFRYLKKNSDVFVPPIEEKIDIREFSEKIVKFATQFWLVDSEKDEVIGFLACYLNDERKKTAYITTVSITKKYQEKGLGFLLLEDCIQLAEDKNFEVMKLEVSKINLKAIKFYEKLDFEIHDCSFLSYFMIKKLSF